MSSGIYNKFTGYHNRKSIRLRGYDYSQPGFYFITLCIHDRKKRIFGDIVDGKMVLNDLGIIAFNQLECLPSRFSNILPDEFQIMPDHIHAVIPIVGGAFAVPPHTDEHNIQIAERLIPSFGIETEAGASREEVAAVIPIVGGTLAVPPHTSENNKQTKDTIFLPFGIGTRAGASPVGEEGAGASPVGEEGAGASPVGEEGAGASPAPTKAKKITIGNIVGAYKSLVANDCLAIYKSKNTHMGKLWQRNYYEHIIRDENSLFRIRKYIRENPLNWTKDKEKHMANEIKEYKMVENQD